MAATFTEELAQIEARIAQVAKEQPGDLETIKRQYAQRIDQIHDALSSAAVAPPIAAPPSPPLET